MTALILDGKKVAQELQGQLRLEVEKLKKEGIFSKLRIILIGNNPSSLIYVKNKTKAAAEIGIESEVVKLKDETDFSEVVSYIKEGNENEKISGMIVQLPLPPHLSEYKIVNQIDPKKDVDGLTSYNLGNILWGRPYFYPCTPLGILELLKFYKIKTEKKKVCILSRSILVGKPLCNMLLTKGEMGDATILVGHTKTPEIKELTRIADIVIVAVGSPRFLKEDMVKEGSVVVDVGVSKVGNEIVGDCDFEGLLKKVSAISPVPGGVGPLTVTCLLRNTVNAAKKWYEH